MATLPRGDTLSDSIAADLRRRIDDGEWGNGDRLPSENALAEHYSVSRATIRTALQDLESRGLMITRRGLGSFVTGQTSGVRADLRHLESISATIAAHGRRPEVVYRSIALRLPEVDGVAVLLVNRLPSDFDTLVDEMLDRTNALAGS